MLFRDKLWVLFQSILDQNGPSLFGHAVGGSRIIGPLVHLNEGSSYLPNDAGNLIGFQRNLPIKNKVLQEYYVDCGKTKGSEW